MMKRCFVLMPSMEGQGTGHAISWEGMMTLEIHTLYTILVFIKVKGQL